MKIYIDFDRTLFDCDRFIEDFNCLLTKYNILKDDFYKYQSQCKNFNPYNILDLMSKEKEVNSGVYHAIDELISKASDYIFPDTIPFLEYLNNHGYMPTILSKGDYDFQMNKILSSNIDLYYGDVIITEKHKGELDLDYANGIFIDDREEELNSIIEKNPKRAILLHRNGVKNKNIETVSSLIELINNI